MKAPILGRGQPNLNEKSPKSSYIAVHLDDENLKLHFVKKLMIFAEINPILSYK